MPSTFRNTIFWLFDRLKGSKVRRHYDAISRINKDHESEFAIRERKKYLSEILQHTMTTVPYYRAIRITDTILNQFPVVDKNLIRKDTGSFRSDSYLKKKIFKSTTSGSTGTPFTVLHDSDKKRRHQSDVLYFGESVGHVWGNGFYYLKIWNKQNRKSKLTKKMQNIVPIDVFRLDDRKIGELLDSIKADATPKSILSYASALDCIVKYLKRNPTELPDGAGLISIIAMSELLDKPTKKYLKEHFNCPVVSRYANIENGILAQQTSVLGNDFLANMASYHIEILDINEDIPVREGETGRIVVTDLFNRAMPLIRYDTGDLGVLGKHKENGNTHYVFKMVEGRKMDAIYDTNDEHISSFALSNYMWKYTELNQYQFIQIGKSKYEFQLNLEGNFSREEELVKEFKGYLGSDAEIDVNYVNEIPLLSSGKRKKVLNRTGIKIE